MSDKRTYIASCSFGKDSIATILLALENGEPHAKPLLLRLQVRQDRARGREINRLGRQTTETF